MSESDGSDGSSGSDDDYSRPIEMMPMDYPPSMEFARVISQKSRGLRSLRIPSLSEASSSAATCTTCAKLDPYGRGMGITMSELMETEEAGCCTCKLLFHALLKTVDWLQTYGWPFHTINISCRGPIVTIKSVIDMFVVHSATILLYTKHDERASAWSLISVHRELGSRVSTYPSILSEWLKKCQEEHPGCSKDEKLLPTRILEVGHVGSDSVRLAVFKDQVKKGRYVALSHCWGGVLDVKLTKDKYDTYQQGISFSDLPLTFQHAVEITRAIGVEFLWIDALCIIQDSTEDWEAESSSMGIIYRDAWLVIGADISVSTTSGFLQSAGIDRKIRKRQEFYGRTGPGVEIAKIDDEETTVFARVHQLHEDFTGLLSTRGIRDNHEKKLPLMNRAWTLQEQFLATRIVHFTNLELIWECNAQLSCECMEMAKYEWRPEVPYHAPWYQQIPGFPITWNARVQLQRCLYTRNATALYQMWRAIAAEALERNITKESDLLPAVAGIADLFQRHGAGEYMAGLWRDDMPHALMWEFENGAERPDSWRGPSWSWVSTRAEPHGSRLAWGRIAPGISKVKVFCRVLEAYCKPKGLNPFGEVESGYLKLSAPILEVRHNGPATKHGHNTPFVPVRRRILPYGLPSFCTLWDQALDEYDPAEVDQRSQWLQERNFHLLFIRGDIMYKKDHFNIGSEGLILTNRLDGSEDTFERVGSFYTINYGGQGILWTKREKVLHYLRYHVLETKKDWVHFAKRGTVHII